jgi:hypothetical protein
MCKLYGVNFQFFDKLKKVSVGCEMVRTLGTVVDTVETNSTRTFENPTTSVKNGSEKLVNNCFLLLLVFLIVL